MKKLFIFIIALSPLLVFAQAATSTFTITSKIGKLNSPARAYLFYQVGANRVVDSALIVDGNFTITGITADPSIAHLLIAHKGEGLEKLEKLNDVLTFFLDKGTITITADRDSVYNAKITGSVINEESNSLTTQLKPINDAAMRLDAESKSAPKNKQTSVDYQRFIYSRSKSLQGAQQSVLQNFVVTHPASYLSLTVLNQLGQLGTEAGDMDGMFNALAPELRNSENGKRLKKSIDISKVTAIGAVAPDFTQADVTGTPVSLSSFKGKYVLIDFWASWCVPCHEENPVLVKLYNKYKVKNFTILGVSLDKAEGKTDWLNAIKNENLDWTQVSDLKFWSNQAAILYNVGILPYNFLIDPNGKIVAKNLRTFDLEDKLGELFGK